MSTRRGRSTYRPRERRTVRERFFGSTGRRVLAFIGIGLFVVIDIVLISLALQSTRPPETTETPRAASGFGAPVETPTPTETPTAEPTEQAPDAAPAGAARFLVAGDASTLWRATAGTCAGTPAVIERSIDAGATWQTLTTGTFDIREVYSLTATNASDVRIVGAGGAACTPGAFVSYTSGDFWAVDAGALDSADYLRPREADDASATAVTAAVTAVVDGVAVAPACDAMQHLVRTGSSVLAVCADGVHVWSTSTSGWTTLPLAGVRSATAVGETVRLALTGVAGCSGVSVQEVDGPLTATSDVTTLGCAAAVGTADGPVGLAGSGTAVWVWSGDRVARSTDAGRTWI